MGQISNVLGRVDFQDNPCDYMDMELNTNRTVHLQSNCWRIELTEQEFREFADTVCDACEKLKNIKKKI
jgi:hypothetical protein